MMGSMSIREFAIWRANCECHAVRRAEQRSVPMTPGEIARLSSLIDRCRQAFEQPNQFRYRIGVKRGDGRRFRVIYDTNLSTVVTVLS